MNKILAGSVAGLAATVPMSWAMEIMHRALPTHERHPLPPREIVERVIELVGAQRHIDDNSRAGLALISHFGYGAAAGSIFAATTEGKPSRALSSGIIYGLAVWLVSYFGLLPALNILSPAHRHPVRRSILMVLAHAVFGSALGIFTDMLCRSDRGKGVGFLSGQGGAKIHHHEVPV